MVEFRRDISLVIFDCDGVLVDSETLAAEVFSDMLARVGITLSPAACFSEFHGKTLAQCYGAVERQFACRLPGNFDAGLRAATQERFADDLRPVEGVVRVLEFLRENAVPFCVASNGGHEKICHSLSVTGLSPYFLQRFSADDVPVGKPAPDLFLHAARHMAVAPSRCLVVEDSLTGCAAARAAGMRVLCYVPQRDKPGNEEFNSMEKLLECLSRELFGSA